MKLFFPVHNYERDALLLGSWGALELAGADRIGRHDGAVDENSIWMVTEMPDAEAVRYEEADSKYIGYRGFILPGDVIDRLTWREVPPDEVARARDPAA